MTINENITCSNRSGVEDTNFEAKESKSIQGQGPTFRGQLLLKPSTVIVEAKVHDKEDQLWVKEAY